MGKDVIIKHRNAKSGVTYVYWGHSYYNQAKKRTDVMKACVGKYTGRGEFVPNKRFLSMSPEEQASTGLIPCPNPAFPDFHAQIADAVSRTKFYGWIAVIERAAKNEHLTEVLRRVFPEHYTILMNLAESAMSVNGTIYNTKKFHAAYWDYAGRQITREETDGAFKEASDKKEAFFGLFKKVRQYSGPYIVCAAEMTDYSSYPSLFKTCGYEKEDDLNKANVFVAFEEETGIPVLYNSIQGNTGDPRTLSVALYGIIHGGYINGGVLVFGCGFWSDENIRCLASSGLDFILSVPASDKLYCETVREVYPDLMLTENYIDEICLSCVKVPYKGGVSEKETGKPEELCLYVFYDPQAGGKVWARESDNFARRLKMLKEDKSGWNPDPDSFSGKYFVPVLDKKGNIVDFKHNDEKQREKKQMSGVYVCLAKKDMDPVRVYNCRKLRRETEEGFGFFGKRNESLKTDGNANPDGYIFIDFLISVLKASLRRRMKEFCLDGKYTLDELADEISSAKYYVPKGKEFSEGEWICLTKEQKILLYSMGIEEMDDLFPGTGNEARLEKLKQAGLKPGPGRNKKENG